MTSHNRLACSGFQTRLRCHCQPVDLKSRKANSSHMRNPYQFPWAGGMVEKGRRGLGVLPPPLSHGPTPQPTRLFEGLDWTLPTLALSGDQTGKRHLLTLGQPQMHLALHSHQVIPPQSLDFLQQLWAGAQAPIRLYQDWSVGRNPLGHPAQQGGDQFHLPKGPSFLMIAPPSQGNGSPAIDPAD